MTKGEIVIVGNNVAAIIAALETGKQRKITLINPTNSWGGHFGGLQDDRNKYDIGMNLFEFSSFQEQSTDILSYNPDKKNDAARFFQHIEQYIRQHISLEPVPCPQVFYRGKYYSDFIISNKLDVLAALSQEELANVQAELAGRALSDHHPNHASRKTVDAQHFLDKMYREVSEYNHGTIIHKEILEPLIQKTVNLNSERMPALVHRLAWLPLYYPDTLRDYILKGCNIASSTTFHYPSKAYFAEIIDIWLQQIQSIQNITIIQEKIKKISSNSNNMLLKLETAEVSTSQLVWCLDPSTFCSLTGIDSAANTDKTSIALLYGEIPLKYLREVFSILNVPEKDFLIYRVSNQTATAGHINAPIHRINCEINSDYAATSGVIDESAIIAKAEEDLVQLNILSDKSIAKRLKLKVFKNALNQPTQNNIESFTRKRRTIVDSFANVQLIGASSSYFSSSFNDQVVQGLKISNKYLEE